jgi:FkbM family methyltransferase
MGLIGMVRKAVRKCGWDIIKYIPAGHPLARREKLLKQYNIGVVFDVGANTGQYGKELREIGYQGKILSFEPLHEAFAQLASQSKKDNNWYIYNYALGDLSGTAKINVSGNSFSSSILEMLPAHMESAPDSKYVDEQNTEIKTLDSVFPELCRHNGNIYLKIDTQGFEKNVLEGGKKSLPLIDTLQIEMSLVPLYQNGWLFDQMYHYLKMLGYVLVSIEPAFSDQITGQLLQVDGIFHRFKI